MTRIFDILLATLGLVILSPLLIFVYVAIVLESRGGGFYRQERTGRYGKPFRLIKFRSMYVNADKHGLITVGGHDNRITRVGYYIRKYKIDELPQLINVVKGDMSIVGPRPEVKKYTDLYTEEQRKILDIRPGITDYASIKYVDENEILGTSDNPERTYIEHIMPDKIKLNMIYISQNGIKEYFKIIFLTLTNIAR
ncbi:MAG: sugar transferase [Prevotella sp.]|nr:sugar transferase [Prevotella sp.]